jgi:hypothetical protein
MPLPKNFSVDPERVVHETIDGETIIIQLETGTYYSLAGSGAEIWAMVAAGSSTDDVTAELARRYEESPETLEEAVLELIRELRREELLLDDPDRGSPDASPNGAAANGSGGGRVPFEPPALQKYTDMQYFLLLDPIHEVDRIGWPNPSDQASG